MIDDDEMVFVDTSTPPPPRFRLRPLPPPPHSVPVRGSSIFFPPPQKVAAASKNVSNVRFVTIKCGQIAGGPNEVFAKVLAAVTGSATRMSGDGALEALRKLTERPPFQVVVSV